MGRPNQTNHLLYQLYTYRSTLDGHKRRADRARELEKAGQESAKVGAYIEPGNCRVLSDKVDFFIEQLERARRGGMAVYVASELVFLLGHQIQEASEQCLKDQNTQLLILKLETDLKMALLEHKKKDDDEDSPETVVQGNFG